MENYFKVYIWNYKSTKMLQQMCITDVWPNLNQAELPSNQEEQGVQTLETKRI